MQSEPIITVENLSKRYQLGVAQKGERYTALRDVIARGASNLLRRGKARENGGEEAGEFWALRDVSFTVGRGEVVGIIGRNGAGKSTLLKVLSRITEPTSGRIKLRGRVASLLEVGTGFHPELTGRENIFLNGAILGMHRHEIKAKFDEIVAFAEVEKFLDTPVKRYSSGMYVRLAFAVAAHLEPEILIVDEVLAVGDAEFQKKCLGKMQDVSKEGRTILFVSHNMGAVEELCSRVIQLKNGRLIADGQDARVAIRSYFGSSQEHQNSTAWQNSGSEFSNSWFVPQRFFLGDKEGLPMQTPCRNDAAMFVYIEGDVKTLDPALNAGYALYDEDGVLLYWTLTTDAANTTWPRLRNGRCLLQSRIPPRFLNEGPYRLELIVSLHHRQWLSQPGANAPSIHLEVRGGLSESSYWMERRPGKLAPFMPWEVKTSVGEVGQN